VWQLEDLSFSPHALKRLSERRISERQVLNTINHPSEFRTRPDGRVVADRLTIAGNTLRVIYVLSEQGLLIVTVMRIAQ
jgi:hypothetical protein